MIYYVCTFIFKKNCVREPIREPRRVGSGRLMSRDSWDSGYRQPENGISSNFNFGKGNFREASHSSMLVFNFIIFLLLIYYYYYYLLLYILENLAEKILILIEENWIDLEIMIVSKVRVILIDVEMILIEHKKNLSG